MNVAKNQKRKPAPRWLGPVVAGGTLLGVGLLARRAKAKPSSNAPQSSDTPAPIPAVPQAPDIRFPVYEGQDGAFMLQELLKGAGVDGDWRRFFLATARGESGFTSNVVLGDPALYPSGSTPSPLTAQLGMSEAGGARQAYERAMTNGRMEVCTWPASAYCWGSGGWLGMLPANAWYAYEHTGLQCRHPWYLLHPVDHVVTAIEFARRLTGWSSFKAMPTWLTLRVGWGNPSAMDDPKARERVATKFGTHLQALGLSKEWMNQKVSALPRLDVEQTWGALMRQFDLEPGSKGT